MATSSLCKLAAVAALLLLPQFSFGQHILQGYVSDSTGGDPLAGVNVFLEGTSFGNATDIEGAFRIVGVPPNTYTVKVSCVGYETREFAVDLSVQEQVTVQIRLLPTVIAGEEILVTAQRKGQIAAINQQLTSNAIVNIVSEERIQELPDANAAEAIGRLPGVSLTRSGGEASHVLIRGLSDKFSVVTIDGVRMSPTNDNDRGTDLSTIAQGSLSGIEIAKALTPDKDADAIAGSVNLVTRKAPAQRYFRIEPRGSYNALEKSVSQYNVTGRYGERYFDNVLGVQLFGNIENTIRSNESTDLNYDQTLQSGKDYDISRLQITYVNEKRKRGGGSLLLDVDTPDSGSVRFSGMWNQTSRNYLTSYRTYPQSGDVSYNYRDRETKITTLTTLLRGENYIAGIEANWNGYFSQASREDPFDYELNMTESSSLSPPAGMRTLPASILKGPVEQWIPYAINNFASSIIQQANDRSQKNVDKELGASLDLNRHYSLGETITGDVKIGGKVRRKSRYNSPVEARSNYYLYAWPVYTRLPDGSIGLKSLAGTRFDPLVVTPANRISFANFLDADPGSRAIFDKYALYPLINRDALRLWRDLNINGYIDANGATKEYIRNNEVDGDYYDVTERVLAGYAMNTLNIGREFTVIAGVRVESDNNDYLSLYTPRPISGFPFPTGELTDTVVYHKETSVLPNLQVIIRPLDFMNIRLAGYRAIARPDFNHRLLKFIARSASGNVLDVGNPDLVNAKAWNAELQTQIYGNTIGLFSVSAFFKYIENMYHVINGVELAGQRVLDSLGIGWKNPFPTQTTKYNLTYPFNSRRPTRVWGFEVEHQTDFKFLPGLLKNIVLNYNFALVRSETWTITSRVESTYVIVPPFPNPLLVTNIVLAEKKQKLEDQPEFFGNVSLGYDIDGFSFRISVFHQSSFNTSFSADQTGDEVQDAYTKWDLAFRQRINDNISVFLNVNNLTDSGESTSIANRSAPVRQTGVSERLLPNDSNKYGRSADLGVRIEF